MKRKVILTELGEEKQCHRCHEFWPVDTEFWYSEGKRGLSRWCIACYQEWRREHKRKNAAPAGEERAAA